MRLLAHAARILWAASCIPAGASGCEDGDREPRVPAETRHTAARGQEAEPRLVEVTPQEIPPLLRAQGGRALMVNVWSTWCKPCVEEFPELLEIAREYEPRGLRALFISADPASQHDEALAFLVAQGAPMPGYVKAGSDMAFIESLHPQWSGTLPATLLFDAERNLVAHWEEPVDRATLSGPIRRALGAGSGGNPSEAVP